MKAENNVNEESPALFIYLSHTVNEINKNGYQRHLIVKKPHIKKLRKEPVAKFTIPDWGI